MNQERFAGLTGKYATLSIAAVGDFCLDRYLEIDPGKAPVWPVTCVGEDGFLRREQLSETGRFHAAVQCKLARPAEFVHTLFTNCRRLPPSSPG